MATTTSAALGRVTTFYKTLLEDQPTAEQLASEAQRVDAGQTSLAKILLDVYNSANRQLGHANEWAEAFFVIVGRAPDPTIFNLGMNMLRSGTSFAALMDAILAIPGHRLSTSGIVDNGDFVSVLYSILTSGGILGGEARDSFARLIDDGAYTRGQLLAAALESSDPLLHIGRESLVQRSLIYLTVLEKGAGAADLLDANGGVASDILYAFNAAGLSIPSGTPYFVRESSLSPTISLRGELTGDLLIDLKSSSFTLAGVSPVKAYYSFDGGIDASLVNISSAQFVGVRYLDASKFTGKGKLVVTGGYTADSYTFIAPPAGATLQGAPGNDVLVGGIGVDKLIATAGQDNLTGGAGVDTFLFAQRSDYLAGQTFTHVTDFGNGADILDFSLLLGSGAASLSKISPILASSTASVVLANGGVALVENNGVWTNGTQSVGATAQNIASLFGVAGTVFKNPTAVSRSVVLTADLSNGADVWVINNDVNVTQIASNEVLLVGHLDGDWNLTLNGLLPIVR